MKSIFTLVACALAMVGTTQTFQGSLRPGSQANSAFCAIRSSTNFTGNPTNLQFTLAVPISVGTRPTLTILNNFYSAQFAANGVTIIQTASTATDYIYLINFAISLFASKTYIANTPDNVVEISFQGNTASTNNLRLVQLADGLATTGAGGENGQYNFYIEYQGADLTNTSAMFFTANGGTVNNNANGYTAFSSVSLGSSIVLPVQFKSFTAQKQSNAALLRWQIDNASDVAQFRVQTLANGTASTIATIPATNATSYQLSDAQFANYAGANVVYRIVALQKDGTPVYSNNAVLAKNSKQTVQLFQAQNISQSVLNFEAEQVGNASLQIFTLDGKLLHQQTKQVMIGFQQWPIQKAFSAGNYLVKAIINNQAYSFQAIQP